MPSTTPTPVPVLVKSTPELLKAKDAVASAHDNPDGPFGRTLTMDFRWMSSGGLLMDGNGDIAVTSTSLEELASMVATRWKASSRSWKLYRMGANFNSFLGEPTGINRNTELAIQRAALRRATLISSAVWVVSGPRPPQSGDAYPCAMAPGSGWPRSGALFQAREQGDAYLGEK